MKVSFPKINFTACGITLATASKHSVAAFGDPGKLIIKVLFLIPLAALNLYHIQLFLDMIYKMKNQYPKNIVHLDSIAIGVIFKLSIIIAMGIPVTSFSITLLVASGVTSRFVKPVPPFVKITLTGSLLLQLCIKNA